METRELLAFGSLTKRFSRQKSIQYKYTTGSFGIRINRGEFVFITGDNGVGKSTLAHMLATLDKGEYSKDSSIRFYEHLNGHIYEHDYWKLFRTRALTLSLYDPTARLRQCCFGFLPQGGHLLDSHTVEENLILRRLLCDLGTKVDFNCLEPELKNYLKKSPSALSGGMRQKLALHRAVAGSPQIIFADEPTSNLDSAAFDGKISELARFVHEQEVTVLTVTHSYDRSLKVLMDKFPTLTIHRLNLQPVGPKNDRVSQVSMEYQTV